MALEITKVVGASRADERQPDDYYATDPIAIEKLLEHESFRNHIWECACGGGHLSNALISNGYSVISTDLVIRKCFPSVFPRQLDFLSAGFMGGWI